MRFLETSDPVGKLSNVSGKGIIIVPWGWEDLGCAALQAIIHQVLTAPCWLHTEFSIMHVANSLCISLIADMLAVQPETLVWTHCVMHHGQTNSLYICASGNVECFCQLSVRYWVCSQNIKHTTIILSSGWAGRWRPCGGVFSLKNTSCLSLS